jgi:hypothetical protein
VFQYQFNPLPRLSRIERAVQVRKHQWTRTHPIQEMSGRYSGFVPLSAVWMTACAKGYATDSVERLKTHCAALARRVFGTQTLPASLPAPPASLRALLELTVEYLGPLISWFQERPVHPAISMATREISMATGLRRIVASTTPYRQGPHRPSPSRSRTPPPTRAAPPSTTFVASLYRGGAHGVSSYGRTGRICVGSSVRALATPWTPPSPSLLNQKESLSKPPHRTNP